MPLSVASTQGQSVPQDPARARAREIAGVCLSLRREAAAAAVGVSEETFDKYLRPSLPVVRLGSVRVYPVAALERWLLENADAPTDELERSR